MEHHEKETILTDGYIIEILKNFSGVSSDGKIWVRYGDFARKIALLSREEEQDRCKVMINKRMSELYKHGEKTPETNARINQLDDIKKELFPEPTHND